jgi:hypothetical protein
MISSIKEFEDVFEQTFGDINKESLSTVPFNRIRFALGDDLPNIDKKVKQVVYRCDQILNDCFAKKDIWLRIILWDRKEKDNLLNAGLNVMYADFILEGNFEGNNILILYKKKFSGSFLKPIILSNINFEIGKNPFAHITCYFINFSIPLVINIYDDRGMDIVSANKELTKNLSNKYKEWIIT